MDTGEVGTAEVGTAEVGTGEVSTHYTSPAWPSALPSSCITHRYPLCYRSLQLMTSPFAHLQMQHPWAADDTSNPDQHMMDPADVLRNLTGHSARVH